MQRQNSHVSQNNYSGSRLMKFWDRLNNSVSKIKQYSLGTTKFNLRHLSGTFQSRQTENQITSHEIRKRKLVTDPS